MVLWTIFVNVSSALLKKSVNKSPSNQPVQKRSVNTSRKPKPKPEYTEDMAKEMKPFQEFMIDAVSKQLNIDPKTIDVEAPLYQYGLKSGI
jgi:hypothetical protein